MGAIVQSVSVTAASGPTTVAVMPSDVTSGNTLIVITGHPGGDECTSGNPLLNAVFTDTRSLTFTQQVVSENPSGAQANSCILTAPITSSGPETITRTIAGTNYPVGMWVAEVSGVFSPTAVSTSTGTADGTTSVSTGNVTSASANLVLVGGGANNAAPAFDSASPSGATTDFSSNGVNAGLIKFVAAGTYSITFGKSGGGGRYAATAAIFTIGDLVEDLSDALSFSDADATNRGYLISEGLTFSESVLDSVTGASPTVLLVADFINLKDSATATFAFSPPGGQRGNIDYDQIRASARAGTGAKLHTLTGSVTTGHSVVFDANGNLVDSGGSGGSGTVTSVAMTVPAGFTVAGSPITTSGTLAVTADSEAANKFYASPDGSSGSPTFRVVAAGDLPLGSSSAFGAVKVDNTTITAAAGVITAAAGANAPGLVLLEQHTASSSASLNFTTCITSTYDEYRIELIGIIPATNAALPYIRVSTDGGSNYISTGSYDWGQLNTTVGGSSGAGSNQVANASGIVVFGDTATGGILNTATPGLVASLVLYDPLNSSNYKIVSGHGLGVYSGNSSRYHFTMSAVYKSATAVNAFQFLFSTGNIASGVVRVYGVKK